MSFVFFFFQSTVNNSIKHVYLENKKMITKSITRMQNAERTVLILTIRVDMRIT